MTDRSGMPPGAGPRTEGTTSRSSAIAQCHRATTYRRFEIGCSSFLSMLRPRAASPVERRGHGRPDDGRRGPGGHDGRLRPIREFHYNRGSTAATSSASVTSIVRSAWRPSGLHHRDRSQRWFPCARHGRDPGGFDLRKRGVRVSNTTRSVAETAVDDRKAMGGRVGTRTERLGTLRYRAGVAEWQTQLT